MDKNLFTTKKQQTLLQFSKLVPLLILLAPRLVFGAGTELCQSIRDFKGFVGCGLAILTLAVPLLIGFAFLSFLYGLLKYVADGANAESRTKASQFIIFGTIGLFVMISVYGLVNVLLNTFSYGGAGGTGGAGVLLDSSGSGGVYDPYYNPSSAETLPASETLPVPPIPPTSPSFSGVGGAQ